MIKWWNCGFISS